MFSQHVQVQRQCARTQLLHGQKLEPFWADDLRALGWLIDEDCRLLAEPMNADLVIRLAPLTKHRKTRRRRKLSALERDQIPIWEGPAA